MNEYIQKTKKELEALGPESDQPIVIEYADGTSLEIPPYRQLLEDQLKLHELADSYIDEMFPKGW
jgi:hypothetical protein